ncbi:MAG: hypothetical protein QNJ40_01510 [Xanthomonadales bacterium]|nr:hypothetical protein [Xanthomonadales bacterium]
MMGNLQDRMFRQVNSAFADRLQRRNRRRPIVVATLLSAVLIGLALNAGGDRIVFVALASLPYWLCMHLLNLSLRGIFELSDERLDEHQVAVRNNAYKTAYGFALVFMVVLVTVASVLDLDRPGTFAVAAFAFLTCALAPRMIAAWSLEDNHDVD